MKKTLKIFEKAYSLLEAAPFPEADSTAPTEGGAPDPTMPAEVPPVEGEPKMLPFTSESEVTYIKTLIKILQAVMSGKKDDTQDVQKIVNFDVESVTPENAREMFTMLTNMFTPVMNDYETTQIDNKFELQNN